MKILSFFSVKFGITEGKSTLQKKDNNGQNTLSLFFICLQIANSMKQYQKNYQLQEEIRETFQANIPTRSIFLKRFCGNILHKIITNGH